MGKFGIRNMTGTAILQGMFSGQLESGVIVVKFIVHPPGSLVTILACLFWIPFFGYLSGVYIFMAVHTALTDTPEFPFAILLVAGKTRRCNMGTIQWHLRFLVVLQGEKASREAIHGMAFAAIRACAIDGKLVVMKIFMAGGTGIVRQRVSHFFRNMAFPAIDGFVFALQGKTGPVVIKLLQVADFYKGIFVVTLGAISAKFPFMHIFMASIALTGQDTTPVLKNGSRGCLHLMAFPAIYLFVFSFQREWCLTVIELAQPTHSRK